MSNTINFKAIIQYLAAIAKRKAGECQGCGGSGYKCDPPSRCYPDCHAGKCGKGCEYAAPCPDCADLRRVAEMAKWGSENNGNCKLTSSSKCTGHCDEHCPSYTTPNHFWIKNPDGGMYRICRDCGISTKENDMEEGGIPCDKLIPTPTIPELRSYMEIVGVWEKFIADLYEVHREVVPISGRIITWRSFVHASDILTSDKFYEVAGEFLKGEVGNEM